MKIHMFKASSLKTLKAWLVVLFFMAAMLINKFLEEGAAGVWDKSIYCRP